MRNVSKTSMPSCGLVILTAALVTTVTSSADADLVPVYGFTFADAMTGQNQFIGSNGKHFWFINPGADNYFQDFYERPTAQTYGNTIATQLVPGYSGNVEPGKQYVAANQYFEYVDIVQGRFGHKNNMLFMGVELFGVNKVGDNGVRTAGFGESTHYNIRISNNASGTGGLLLTAENPKDLNGNWQSVESFGYLDVDFGLGSNLNGYEQKVINDGKLLATNQTILQLRRVTSDDGRPMVEFAFDFEAFNAAHGAHALDLSEEMFVVFEATRGLKGPSNYLWNDKYTFGEAGNPYSAPGLGNIYELDTLAASFLIPQPGALALLAVASLISVNRRRK